MLLTAMLAVHAAQAQGVALWSAGLAAPPAQAPWVVDAQAAPGSEVLALDRAGTAYCWAATGALLWSQPLGTDIPEGARGAAIGMTPENPARLLVCGADGLLRAIDAGTGQEVWNHDLGAKGEPVWVAAADLERAGRPAAVAVVRGGGIWALDAADGRLLWQYPDAGDDPLRATGPPALFDTDEDGDAEVFVPCAEGVVALAGDGRELFLAVEGAGILGGLAVADLDDDGDFEVYGVLESGAELIALAADRGDEAWRCPLPGAKTAPAPMIAIGDLDRDENGELYIAAGPLYAVSHEGKLLWSTSATDLGGPSIALADANSDGEIDLLLAEEQGIALLDPAGALQATVPAAGVRAGPLLAALSPEQGAALLWVDSANTVQVYRSGARYVPALAPWPAPQRDASQRAGAASPLREREQDSGGAGLVVENKPLLAADGFGTPDTGPQGWSILPEGAGTVTLEPSPLAGGGVIAVVASSASDTAPALAMQPEPLAPALRTVSATVLGKDAARALLRWTGRGGGVLVEQELRKADVTPEGWQRFRLGETTKPRGATGVALVLVGLPDAPPAQWAQPQIQAAFERVPVVQVFHNQVGYELAAPKHFTAAASFAGQDATFRILDREGVEAHAGRFEAAIPIQGAYGSDWGMHYWRGDFTALNTPGTYRIEVSVDGAKTVSAPFEIDQDLLWNRTFPLVSAALEAHRCDDARVGAVIPCGGPPAGGWHEGDGTGRDKTPQHAHALAEVYSMLRWRLDIPNMEEPPVLLQEVLWSADYLIAAASTAAADADLSVEAAALAALARLNPKEPRLLEAAQAAMRHERTRGADGPMAFAALLDLFTATRDPAIESEVRALYKAEASGPPESVVRYENEVDEMSMVSFSLGKRLSDETDALLKLADNPFGIATRKLDGQTNFFATPPPGSDAPLLGNTAAILEAATTAARAYRFNPKREYQTFIFDQLNWILGNNPAGICLIEGLGAANLPTYARAYAPDLPRGAMAGTIANGFAPMAAGDDRPRLDLSGAAMPDPVTNACTVSNIVRYLEAVGNLKRIRVSAGARSAS